VTALEVRITGAFLVVSWGVISGVIVAIFLLYLDFIITDALQGNKDSKTW
jgi:hypothetical protein